MRVLHMVASISRESGGPTEVIRMLVRHAPPGDTAEVVTLDDPAAPFLRDLPFPVHALGSAKKRWYSPKLIPWIRTNRSRFDAAIVHGLWQYTGLAARLTLEGRVPYAVFPHGMLDPWFQRDRFKYLKKQIYWLLAEGWVLRAALRVLFTTERERDLASDTFWPSRWKATVTPIGTESPPPDTASLLNAFYQRCPELKDKRFLLFLGRIDPKKGCDLLIHAFAGYCENDPDVHLVMAGPDSNNWQSVLMKNSQTGTWAKRVHWPGMLTDDSKWGALAACEVFVLISHQENFGVAVVEALASGKPVLLSDQINIAAEVVSQGCGYAAPDTLEGAYALLRDWHNTSAAKRAVMSERATLTFATHYDMRRNTDAVLGVFEQPAEVH